MSSLQVAVDGVTKALTIIKSIEDRKYEQEMLRALRIGRTTLDLILDAQGWHIGGNRVLDSKNQWVGTIEGTDPYTLTIDKAYLCVILAGKRTEEI